MENKTCSKCSLEKNESEFNLYSSKNPILKSYCKVCQKEYDEYYARTPHGLITSLYKSLKSSSKTRKHAPPAFSKVDFTEWLYKNNYSEIYKEWVMSNYDRDKRPSVDRLRDDLSYFFDNMRLITWKENDKKYKDSVKIPIEVINLENSCSQSFESVRFASRVLSVNNCTILYNLDSGNVINNKYIFKKLQNEK